MLAATPQSDYNSIPNHEDSVNDFNRLQQPKRNCYSIIHDLLGFEVLRSLHPDAVLLMWGKVLRLFSFGFLAVILVVYLAELGFPATDIGLLQTWTLLGDAIISIVMTSHADKIGRRTMLIAGALLSIVTSIVFATQRNFWVLLVSAIIGVISPSGNEIGPFMAIELSGLSQVSRDSDRTRLLAWYNLFGCFASAIGGLFCGVLITHLTESVGVTVLNAYRIVMMVYAAIQVLLCMLFANLGGDIEVPRDQARVREANPVSLFWGLHKSKMIVLRLSLLFMVDAFAGAFVLQSLISNWFLVRFGTSHAVLGTIVFICNIVAGVSALFAAKLADVVGLIMTMVVTHLPSNVLLILVPLMPNGDLAMLMLCLRYCISQMDVPTRNAYVQGVVDPDERSAANGVTNVVRSFGAATAPYLAGLLYANPTTLNYPWLIAGGLKIVYDLALLASFHSVKPDTERESSALPLSLPLPLSQKSAATVTVLAKPVSNPSLSLVTGISEKAKAVSVPVSVQHTNK